MQEIIPIARSFVEREHLELIFVSDGDAQDQAAW